MSELEVCHTGFYAFDAKAVAEDGTLEGYASTFGNVDLQGDVVLSGAFTDTIKKHDHVWPMLMAHSLGRPVGYVIDAAEDQKGLWFKGQFTLDSDEGKNAAATVRHGLAVGHRPGVSIGYRIPQNGAEWDESTNTRKLKKIDLLEISLAMVPANPRARVSRMKAASEMDIREFEEVLRDLGFSKARACAIASHGFRASDRSESDDSQAEEQKRAAEAFIAELRSAAIVFEFQKGLVIRG